MEKRANDATLELHELLDQTGVVEQDLKNTFNAFRNLSHSQFIENASTTANVSMKLLKWFVEL